MRASISLAPASDAASESQYSARRGTSSGQIAACHPKPRASSRVRPVYSDQRRLTNSALPSAAAVQISSEIVSSVAAVQRRLDLGDDRQRDLLRRVSAE